MAGAGFFVDLAYSDGESSRQADVALRSPALENRGHGGRRFCELPHGIRGQRVGGISRGLQLETLPPASLLHSAVWCPTGSVRIMTVGMAVALGAGRLDTATAIRSDAALYVRWFEPQPASCQARRFG